MTDSLPEPAAIRAIAARHGVRPGQVTAVPGGVANHAFTLGDRLFLRIPRDRFVPQLRKEAAVIPAARAAGVRTPGIVEFDDNRTLIDSPYMVLERVQGTDLALHTPAPGQRAAMLRELGRELARLHRITEATADPRITLEHDDGGDPRPMVERLAGKGYVDPGTADWLTGWFERLERRSPARPHGLLHGDIGPRNLLLDPASGAFRAIADWGDACWAEPAMEFAKLELSDVIPTLQGYREECGPTGDDGALEARVLWYHLGWGLSAAARRHPRPGERDWSAPPLSRLLGVLRFLADSPPAPWPDLG